LITREDTDEHDAPFSHVAGLECTAWARRAVGDGAGDGTQTAPEEVMDRLEYRRSLGLPNLGLDEKLTCPRCEADCDGEPDGCRDPHCPMIPWPEPR
jgi:hypothetical protein